MIGLLETLSTYPFWTVLIIAMASIIIILKIIDWCKKIWAKRNEFRQAAFLEGERVQQQEDCQAHDKEALEKRLKALENNYIALTNMLEAQQATLNLLKESDELDIKAWIKAQHERWVPTGYIDSQALELVCQRFAIYQKEGGNSWAEKMVEDIKRLTIVTNIPLE